MNPTLQERTGELSNALRDLDNVRQTLESRLKEEVENHQVTKQLLEQERRDLNAIIREREEQLRRCRDELANYGQLARLLNEQVRVDSAVSFRGSCLLIYFYFFLNSVRLVRT